MKFKNQLLPLAISGLLTLGFTSCSDDDDSSSGGGEVETELTIAGFLSDDDTQGYSLLLAAAEYAELDDELADPANNFTVLAPNDTAFTAWLDGAALTDFSKEEVAQVLLNHIIDSELKATDVVAAVPAYLTTLASDSNANIDIFVDSDLYINGVDGAQITATDAYDATNGIIHGIDKVITGTAPLTIAGFVSNSDDYSTLLAAVEYAGLVDTLNSLDENLTVFAPNNAAFTTWLNGAELTDFTTDEVEQVLLNHVIGSELKAATVTSAVPTYQSTLATGPNNLAEAATNISIFIDADLMVNGQSEITGADAYDATNGIIHAVDTVIDLPNITTFATADERVSVLAGLLTDEELVDDIMGLTTATVLAPLNAAFDGFAPPVGLSVSEILQYHVINGVNAVASDAIGLTETPATLQTETITVAAVDGAPQFTGNGNTEAATVVIADIQATNGVIHVIDSALLPAIPAIVVTK